VELAAFEALVKSINDFWLTKTKFPQPEQEEALGQTGLRGRT
jgi:hypothetical protein